MIKFISVTYIFSTCVLDIRFYNLIIKVSSFHFIILYFKSSGCILTIGYLASKSSILKSVLTSFLHF